jgi:hypothetical protein
MFMCKCYRRSMICSNGYLGRLHSIAPVIIRAHRVFDGTLQRMWEFAIGLILLQLHPDSLVLVAVYGMVDSGVQVIAGPYLGSYVDRLDTRLACRLMSTCRLGATYVGPPCLARRGS